MKALVLIADGSEEIEACTVIDVLRRAKMEVTVAAIGTHSTTVTLSRGVKVIADISLPDIVSFASNYAVIILPGGLQGAKAFSNDHLVQKLLKEFEEADKLVAAMCASTTVLHAAGIGKGKRATS